MRRHQIRYKVLFPAKRQVRLLICLRKRAVNPDARFSHFFQHCIGDVLGRHFQLTADMVFAQFPQKSAVFIVHQIVEPDSGADKDFFHPGNRPQLPEQSQVIAVICI